ncbi:MAG: hypothetical protein ACREH6_13200 [Geminicoccaceae bacterium]
MRYVAFALALAFGLGTVSVVAAACPGHQLNASKDLTIASTEGSGGAPSTPVQVPTPSPKR